MLFDYQYLIDKSVLNVLKQILNYIQNNGLSDDQSFYISFLTNSKGVILSKTVKQKYSKEITIVLQHQFKDLKVLDKKFTVNLAFNGIAEDIEVPFDAITSFLDPVANFGFQFVTHKNHHQDKKAFIVNRAEILSSEFKLSKRKIRTVNKEATIIALDKFRKKREEEDKI
jgi:hypothetical protein